MLSGLRVRPSPFEKRPLAEPCRGPGGIGVFSLNLMIVLMKSTARAIIAGIALALSQVPVVAVAQQLPVLGPQDRQNEAPAEAADDRGREDRRSRADDMPASGPVLFDPLRLQPEEARQERERTDSDLLGRNIRLRPPPAPNEFESYVELVTGRKVRRFGQSLLLEESRDFAVPATSTVPPDYRLNPGDTVVLYLTGAVDGTVEREIDNDGNIYLPSVGTIKVAGVRYADLRSTLVRAIGAEYRFFDVNVTMRSLRGVRVYVTGFANNPGAFTLSSLATAINAVLQAGGPNSGGSFRSVKIYRNGREIADLDLYRLLRGGLRDGDIVLQNEDVLFIPPVGEQVAVIGSVQEEAIYELRAGETLADALRLAGGANVLADADRMILYRTSDLTNREPIEVPMAEAATRPAKGGDLIELLSRGTLVQPIARQSILVRIEGEVERPGNYYVPPNTSLDEALALAGGLTSRAYLFGTRLERFSVRQQQRRSFDEALEQFRFAIAAAPLEGGSDQGAGRRAAEIASAQSVLDLLATREPDGRVILDLTPTSTNLPSGDFLEQNDRIVIPAMPSTVGVFGAVYRPGSFLIQGRGRKLGEYINQAGGPLRAADRRRAFVVRANGEVLIHSKGMMKADALPGDVVFIPVRTRTNDIWTQIRDITTIIFQLGLTAAVFESIR